ncbi:MAG: MFS transporter [Hyphomicrobiales bacterium]|nr:MAG: MFS transporter [Hyphomicrobiales bacterium]
MTSPARSGLRVTLLLAANAFAMGCIFASTVNYGSIVAIEALGLPNAAYSLILSVSSLVGAAAALALGYLSDRMPDRRLLVIGCALTGAVGLGLILLFRTQLAFIAAMCVLLPFGMAVFSQSFAYARAYYNREAPARAEFMNSVMRTIFAVAWTVLPPIVGWVAVSNGVFSVYGIAIAAYLASAAIFTLILMTPEGRVAGAPKAADGRSTAPAAAIDPAIMVGIGGLFLIMMATQITMVSTPLLVTITLGGSYADLGLYAGLAAGVELPFMLLWGYLLRWVPKYAIIAAAALLYGLYLYFLSRAGSVTEILWLQLLNGPATAALVSIPISYMQDAIRNRVGLSTSLLDVTRVAAVIASAGLFGLLTSASPDYPLMFVVAAGLAAGGAVILVAAHLFVGARPATAR